MESQVPTGKNTLIDKSTGGETTARGGGGFFNNQRGGRQDSAANGGESVLDLPGDMAVG